MTDKYRNTSARVYPGYRYYTGLPSWEHVLKCWKKVVYKQECLVQVICRRDICSHQRILCANHVVFVQKKLNKLKRICKHKSSSKSVNIVANIHVSLQFCGKAALKRRIAIPYKYRASEGKIHFVSFFSTKILIVGLIVKLYRPFSQ